MRALHLFCSQKQSAALCTTVVAEVMYEWRLCTRALGYGSLRRLLVGYPLTPGLCSPLAFSQSSGHLIRTASIYRRAADAAAVGRADHPQCRFYSTITAPAVFA